MVFDLLEVCAAARAAQLLTPDLRDIGIYTNSEVVGALWLWVHKVGSKVDAIVEGSRCFQVSYGSAD